MVVTSMQRSDRFKAIQHLSQQQVKAALDQAIIQIDSNIDYFNETFPTPATKDNIYEKMPNTEWTTGFWTGILWLAYEYTHDEKYQKLALRQVDSFLKRIVAKDHVDHHDLGFLYTPSCVSAYKLLGSQKAYAASILAAEQLASRFQEKGGFIQAWGGTGAEDNYRLIIDALLNIPLLYWAGNEQHNKTYLEMADRHYKAAKETVIREDGSTYHTYYFDKLTGKPEKGVTRQGYSDDSSWARGQAWAIYGVPLHYKYKHSEDDIALFEKVTNYFIDKLPDDYVPYWDLIFSEQDKQPRDSSAGAIAVCGLAEMMKYLPESNANKQTYTNVMHALLSELIANYAADDNVPGETLLKHGVYSWHSGKGVDEGNLWGDYFYMEALMRFYKDWQLYW